MPENPLEVFKRVDPELFELAEESRKLALAEDGALPKKFKYLIAMSLDAAHGAVGGVTSLAQAAMRAGATKEEVAETLRVTHYISGVGSIYTSARALKDVL